MNVGIGDVGADCYCFCWMFVVVIDVVEQKIAQSKHCFNHRSRLIEITWNINALSVWGFPKESPIRPQCLLSSLCLSFPLTTSVCQLHRTGYFNFCIRQTERQWIWDGITLCFVQTNNVDSDAHQCLDKSLSMTANLCQSLQAFSFQMIMINRSILLNHSKGFSIHPLILISLQFTTQPIGCETKIS